MKVLCTLPNASGSINGITFSRIASGHLLSQDLSDEQAKRFLSIPGYLLYKEPEAKVEPAAPVSTQKQGEPSKGVDEQEREEEVDDENETDEDQDDDSEDSENSGDEDEDDKIKEVKKPAPTPSPVKKGKQKRR